MPILFWDSARRRPRTRDEEDGESDRRQSQLWPPGNHERREVSHDTFPADMCWSRLALPGGHSWLCRRPISPQKQTRLAFHNIKWAQCYDGDPCTFTISNVRPLLDNTILVKAGPDRFPERTTRCEEKKKAALQARDALVDRRRLVQEIQLQNVDFQKCFHLLAEVTGDRQNFSDRRLTLLSTDGYRPRALYATTSFGHRDFPIGVAKLGGGQEPDGSPMSRALPSLS